MAIFVLWLCVQGGNGSARVTASKWWDRNSDPALAGSTVRSVLGWMGVWGAWCCLQTPLPLGTGIVYKKGLFVGLSNWQESRSPLTCLFAGFPYLSIVWV